MVGGDHAERRHQQEVGDVVVLRPLECAEVHGRRKQGDAVEGNPAIGKKAGDTRRPRGAVALTQDEQRRRPALVSRHVQPNEFSESLDVAFYAQEFLDGLGVGGAAEAGRDRIHKHEVAAIEQRIGIVRDRVGRRRHEAIRLEHHLLGTDSAHVQPHGRGPRPAVEAKRQRTLGGFLAVERVSDEEHLGFDLAVAPLDGQASCGGRVAQELPVDRDLVMAHGWRDLRHVVVFFANAFFAGLWLGLCLGLWRGGLRFGCLGLRIRRGGGLRLFFLSRARSFGSLGGIRLLREDAER